MSTITITDEQIYEASHAYWEVWRVKTKSASVGIGAFDVPFAELSDRTKSLTRECMLAALEAADRARAVPNIDMMSDETILLVHDHCHTVMDERWGNKINDGRSRKAKAYRDLTRPLPTPPEQTP